MVLGEKVKDPLNHDLRYILLNIILKYKRTGIRLVELSRITGKRNHSLRHHLDILEQKRYVYTKKSTHQLYYFPDPNIPKHTHIGHPLENEFRSKLLSTILDHNGNGVNLGALYRKLKVSKNRAIRGLKILNHFELINLKHGGTDTFCYPTPKTQGLIKYVKNKKGLFLSIKDEEGILLKDLIDEMDHIGLDNFKLCVYTRKHGQDTFYYLTPFVENLLDKYGA